MAYRVALVATWTKKAAWSFLRPQVQYLESEFAANAAAALLDKQKDPNDHSTKGPKNGEPKGPERRWWRPSG